MRRGVIIGMAVAVSVCGAAIAQDDKVTEPPIPPAQAVQPQGDQQNQATDPVAAMIGAWELSNADHDKACKLNFRNDPAPGGYRVDIDKNCATVFPSSKAIVAWAIDNFGGLRLLDGGGEAVIELSQVEGGMFDGFKLEEGRYVLQAAAAVHTRSAEDVIGDWAIERPYVDYAAYFPSKGAIPTLTRSSGHSRSPRGEQPAGKYRNPRPSRKALPLYVGPIHAGRKSDHRTCDSD